MGSSRTVLPLQSSAVREESDSQHKEQLGKPSEPDLRCGNSLNRGPGARAQFNSNPSMLSACLSFKKYSQFPFIKGTWLRKRKDCIKTLRESAGLILALLIMTLKALSAALNSS
jgi:hypothetical protein